jgi:hypothetical protein
MLAELREQEGKVDREQRAKDDEAALWCLHIHGYTREDHTSMSCACAPVTKAMLDKMDKVRGIAPAPALCDVPGCVDGRVWTWTGENSATSSDCPKCHPKCDVPGCVDGKVRELRDSENAWTDCPKCRPAKPTTEGGRG